MKRCLAITIALLTTSYYSTNYSVKGHPPISPRTLPVQMQEVKAIEVPEYMTKGQIHILGVLLTWQQQQARYNAEKSTASLSKEKEITIKEQKLRNEIVAALAGTWWLRPAFSHALPSCKKISKKSHTHLIYLALNLA